MARSENFENIGNILPRLTASLTGRKEYLKHLFFYHWRDIAGGDIARHVRPVRLDFKTLYLAADAPVWANELRYMERDIIDKINAFVCEEMVKEIHFTVDKGKAGISWPLDSSGPPEKEMPSPATEEMEQAMDVCETVKDEELKQAAAKALAQSLARRRGLEDTYHACAGCGVLCPREKTLCPVCEAKEQQDFHSVVRALMEAQPWLKYHQIHQRTGAPADIVREERIKLMQEAAGRIESGDRESPGISRFVMLATTARPEELTEEFIKKTLKRYRFDFKPPAGKTGKKLFRRRRFEGGK
ncbi:MAG: DUF721 domain-containing protein [Schwartzia sp.]|nr:DUF721 domain-containing protein [Schwartzia sp. (in: firmicutes)]